MLLEPYAVSRKSRFTPKSSYIDTLDEFGEAIKADVPPFTDEGGTLFVCWNKLFAVVCLLGFSVGND